MASQIIDNHSKYLIVRYGTEQDEELVLIKSNDPNLKTRIIRELETTDGSFSAQQRVMDRLIHSNEFEVIPADYLYNIM